LCTTSEDATAKLWILKDPKGLTEHLMEEDAKLTGHNKKVLSVEWHNTVNNMLATSSMDNTVRVWDVEKQVNVSAFVHVKNMATCLKWAPKGDVMAVNGRGGHLQTFDIRQKDQFNYVKCHDGPKF
jgi:coronin-1B/1C/6